MTTRILVFSLLVLSFAAAFNIPVPHPSNPTTATRSSHSASLLFGRQPRRQNQISDDDDNDHNVTPKWRRILDRFDTTASAGIVDAKGAGLIDRIKGLHGPKTYLALALLAGLKWKWCFRNPYYWFGVAFCIKWYRARYVFKIPVWDRQPNWNNIITSKEQEKDLKAYTCKVCGSTLFIAKTREFFFEGNTGIGGLGCFSCGAKGKENFVMDRDRIVEDVADMDDYFEYERPLDFVSRAERRKLLKEAGGDEEKANQILMERAGGESGSSSTPESEINGDKVNSAEDETAEIVPDEGDTKKVKPPTDSPSVEPAEAKAEESVESKTEKKPKKKKKSTKKAPSKKSTPVVDDSPMDGNDDLDVLDMDSF